MRSALFVSSLVLLLTLAASKTVKVERHHGAISIDPIRKHTPEEVQAWRDEAKKNPMSPENHPSNKPRGRVPEDIDETRSWSVIEELIEDDDPEILSDGDPFIRARLESDEHLDSSTTRGATPVRAPPSARAPEWTVSGSNDRTQFGRSWPSDGGLCVGPNQVWAGTNAQVYLYDKSNIESAPTVLDTIDHDDFFGSGSFDPVCTYDDTSNGGRFVAIAIVGNSPPNTVRIAVSKDSTPTDLSTSQWDFFSINMDPSEGVWADYPVMGVDGSRIQFTVNMFTAGGSFRRDDLWFFPKSQAYGGSSITASKFEDINGSRAHPVSSWDNGGASYICGTSFSGMRLFTNDGTTLDRKTVSGTGFNRPPFGTDAAPQLGSGPDLDIRDTSMESCQLMGGKLYAAHRVLSSAGNAASKWLIVNPTTGTLIDSGSVSDSTNHYYYPVLVVDTEGNIGMGYSRSSNSEFVSIYTSYRLADDPAGQISVPRKIRAGSTTYFAPQGASNRWGDYAAGHLDPSDRRRMWWQIQLPVGTGDWQVFIHTECPSCDICPNGCVRGTCNNAVCDCDAGWTGIDCNTPECVPACTGGTCTAPNVCTCPSGCTDPPACDKCDCDPPCATHAICNAFVCDECETGWESPPNCDQPICSGCTGPQSNCVSPGNCVCDPGWTNAPACDVETCDPDCGAHGSCVNQVCVCDVLWEGEDCSTPLCDPECGEEGVCQENHECLCNEGWNNPPACREPVCWGEQECVHGDCVAPGVCECHDGWKQDPPLDTVCNTTRLFFNEDDGAPTTLNQAVVVGSLMGVVCLIGAAAALNNDEGDNLDAAPKGYRKTMHQVRRGISRRLPPTPQHARTPWKRFTYRAGHAANKVRRRTPPEMRPPPGALAPRKTGAYGAGKTPEVAPAVREARFTQGAWKLDDGRNPVGAPRNNNSKGQKGGAGGSKRRPTNPEGRKGSQGSRGGRGGSKHKKSTGSKGGRPGAGGSNRKKSSLGAKGGRPGGGSNRKKSSNGSKTNRGAPGGGGSGRKGGSNRKAR